MPKPTKFDGMMHEFCVGLGFCGSLMDGEPRYVTDYVPKQGQVSADDFVVWLLLAEGFRPDEDKEARRWKRELKAVFVKHMQSEYVDGGNSPIPLLERYSAKRLQIAFRKLMRNRTIRG